MSSSEESSDNEWVESAEPTKSQPTSTLQRDSWMSGEGVDFAAAIGATLKGASKRDRLRNIEKEKDEWIKIRRERAKADSAPDASEKVNESRPNPAPHVPKTDGGATWLHRALKRAKEQAATENRPLEEVAAERWGSLQKLLDMIAAAEAKGKGGDAEPPKPLKVYGAQGPPDTIPSRREERTRKSWRRRSRSSSRDRQGRRERSHSKDRIRRKWRKRSRSRSRSNDRTKRTSKRGRDERSRRSRSRSNSDNRRRSRSKSIEHRRQNRHQRKSPSTEEISVSHDDETKDSQALTTPVPESDRAAERSSGKKGDESSSPPVTDSRRLIPTSQKTKGSRKPGDVIQGKLVSSKIAEKLSGWTGKDFILSDAAETQTVPTVENNEGESDDAEPKTRPLTLEERNKLGAKILKAEMLGKAALVAKLKSQLESGVVEIEPSMQKSEPQPSEPSEVILTRTDLRTGYTEPLNIDRDTGVPIKKKKLPTAEELYKTEDAESTIRDLVEAERTQTAEDQSIEFAEMIAKGGPTSQQLDTQDEMTADDIYMAKKPPSEAKVKESQVRQAIKEHKIREQTLDSCRLCIDSKKLAKHLVVSLGQHAYLALPAKPLVPGHSLVVPFGHVGSTRQLDENIYGEMREFLKSLTAMWKTQDSDLVVLETVLNLHKLPHAILHCVPIEGSNAELAPMYFQKAILEAEGEWLQNKRLIKFGPEGLVGKIPVGMPYFAVQFGTSGGFAHVIENERTFPKDFGTETLGGILELDRLQLRHRETQDFAAQMKRVAGFKDDYQKFHFLDSD